MSVEDKVIEEGAKTARRYLDAILLAPLSELGLLAKDRISFWRFKNQVNTLLKAKEFLEKKGVNPESIAGTVSPNSIIPLIESASNTDESTLSQMFASLIAGALTPDSAQLIHPSYGKVLDQLSPLDAQILQLLHKNIEKRTNEIKNGNYPEGYNDKIPIHRQFGFDEEKLAKTIHRPTEYIRISFQNVMRLGICDRGKDALANMNQLSRISFTDYGLEFVKRCTENIQ